MNKQQRQRRIIDAFIANENRRIDIENANQSNVEFHSLHDVVDEYYIDDFCHITRNNVTTCVMCISRRDDDDHYHIVASFDNDDKCELLSIRDDCNNTIDVIS